MALDLDMENMKRWTAHLEKFKETFETTNVNHQALVTELSKAGLVDGYEKADVLIQLPRVFRRKYEFNLNLQDRLKGVKVYDVLCSLKPTWKQVEEIAEILWKNGCRLLAQIVTRFNTSEAYFLNMTSRQVEISKLVINAGASLNAIGLPSSENIENGEIAKNVLVGALALKELHELPDILVRLETVGEIALCEAIKSCAGSHHPFQGSTSLQGLNQQYYPAVAVLPQPAVLYQVNPVPVGTAPSPKAEQPLNIPFEVWREFLRINDIELRMTLKLESAVVNTLRSKEVLSDIEVGQIFSKAESELDARASMFLKMIEDRSSKIKDMIATFENRLHPRVSPFRLLLSFYHQQELEQQYSTSNLNGQHAVVNHALVATPGGVTASAVDSQGQTSPTFPGYSNQATVHPTLQVSSQGTLVNLENFQAPATPGSVNVVNVNIANKTETNVFSINNNMRYFQANAEAYKFLNFALPKDDAEECQWTLPENFKDGPCLAKPTKKFQTSGNGLALLLNWKFDTELGKLPEEIRKNKKALHFYTGLERDGAEQDTKYVCSRFAELTGNEVLEKHNVATIKELHETMEAFRNHALSMNPPPAYLTVIVSTHGLNGYKLILDHLGLADLFKDIVYQLSHEAPGFKDSAHFGPDMPRLFFVQACQEEMRSEVAAGIKNEFPNVLNSASNFLVGLATIPCNVSWRHEIKGSYYIKAIFDCFSKGRSLHEMLKEVDETVRSSVDQKTSAYVSLDFPLTEFAF